VWPEGRTGVEVRVEGFSQKLGLLTQTIFARLADLHTQARRRAPSVNFQRSCCASRGLCKWDALRLQCLCDTERPRGACEARRIM